MPMPEGPSEDSGPRTSQDESRAPTHPISLDVIIKLPNSILEHLKSVEMNEDHSRDRQSQALPEKQERAEGEDAYISDLKDDSTVDGGERVPRLKSTRKRARSGSTIIHRPAGK